MSMRGGSGDGYETMAISIGLRHQCQSTTRRKQMTDVVEIVTQRREVDFYPSSRVRIHTKIVAQMV